MAYSMVAVYGMTPELGLVSYGQNNSSQQFYKPYSRWDDVDGLVILVARCKSYRQDGDFSEDDASLQ